MGRIVISIILGLFSPIVFIIGAAPFAVHGEASVQAVLAGSIALALYLAVCQFLVARSGGRGLRTGIAEIGGLDGEAISLGQHGRGGISGLLFDWPILFAMVAPLLAMVLLIAAVEKPSTVLAQGIPMLVAGCIGSLAGALLAKLVSPHAHTAKR
jgi:hypothetical protein